MKWIWQALCEVGRLVLQIIFDVVLLDYQHQVLLALRGAGEGLRWFELRDRVRMSAELFDELRTMMLESGVIAIDGAVWTITPLGRELLDHLQWLSESELRQHVQW